MLRRAVVSCHCRRHDSTPAVHTPLRACVTYPTVRDFFSSYHSYNNNTNKFQKLHPRCNFSTHTTATLPLTRGTAVACHLPCSAQDAMFISARHYYSNGYSRCSNANSHGNSQVSNRSGSSGERNRDQQQQQSPSSQRGTAVHRNADPSSSSSSSPVLPHSTQPATATGGGRGGSSLNQLITERIAALQKQDLVSGNNVSNSSSYGGGGGGGDISRQSFSFFYRAQSTTTAATATATAAVDANTGGYNDALFSRHSTSNSHRTGTGTQHGSRVQSTLSDDHHDGTAGGFDVSPSERLDEVAPGIHLYTNAADYLGFHLPPAFLLRAAMATAASTEAAAAATVAAARATLEEDEDEEVEGNGARIAASVAAASDDGVPTAFDKNKKNGSMSSSPVGSSTNRGDDTDTAGGAAFYYGQVVSTFCVSPVVTAYGCHWQWRPVRVHLDPSINGGDAVNASTNAHSDNNSGSNTPQPPLAITAHANPDAKDVARARESLARPVFVMIPFLLCPINGNLAAVGLGVNSNSNSIEDERYIAQLRRQVTRAPFIDAAAVPFIIQGCLAATGGGVCDGNIINNKDDVDDASDAGNITDNTINNSCASVAAHRGGGVVQPGGNPPAPDAYSSPSPSSFSFSVSSPTAVAAVLAPALVASLPTLIGEVAATVGDLAPPGTKASAAAAIQAHNSNKSNKSRWLFPPRSGGTHSNDSERIRGIAAAASAVAVAKSAWVRLFLSMALGAPLQSPTTATTTTSTAINTATTTTTTYSHVFNTADPQEDVAYEEEEEKEEEGEQDGIEAGAAAAAAAPRVVDLFLPEITKGTTTTAVDDDGNGNGKDEGQAIPTVDAASTQRAVAHHDSAESATCSPKEEEEGREDDQKQNHKSTATSASTNIVVDGDAIDDDRVGPHHHHRRHSTPPPPPPPPSGLPACYSNVILGGLAELLLSVDRYAALIVRRDITFSAACFALLADSKEAADVAALAWGGGGDNEGEGEEGWSGIRANLSSSPSSSSWLPSNNSNAFSSALSPTRLPSAFAIERELSAAVAAQAALAAVAVQVNRTSVGKSSEETVSLFGARAKSNKK